MSWKKKVLKDEEIFNNHINSSGILEWNAPKSLSLKFHERMEKGAALRELQSQHLHLSYWETPYYKNAINRFIENVPANGTVLLDIGCGDGRFTELLLENGFSKIIATDIHFKPLQSLADYLKKKGWEDRVLLIQSSADGLPLKRGIADVILAIGVFYYLNENFETALTNAVSILKEGGIMVNSEPDLEGAIYKSIFFESIDDVIENFEDKKFKEEKGETPFKFRLFEKKDMPKLFQENGLKVVDHHGLSLLPSILRIKMVRGEFSREEVTANEQKIREIFDYFDGNDSLSKHIIWKSIKEQ